MEKIEAEQQLDTAMYCLKNVIRSLALADRKNVKSKSH